MERLLQQTFKLKENGTHGRKWYTNEANNIAFSFYIDVNCLKIIKNVQDIDGITIKIAQTIIKTLKELYNIKLQIKFPNDIVYKGKKIGGILTQTKLMGTKIKYIVVGIRAKYKSREI